MKKFLTPLFAILFLYSCGIDSMNDMQPDLEITSADLLSEGIATDKLNTKMLLEPEMEASADGRVQSVLPTSDKCTLAPGYWKTHSEFGPAQYDETWALLPNGASTVFYLSGATWLQVFNTPPASNTYYQLAHQFMAAKLNVIGGADPSAVLGELSAAEVLFSTFTPAQAAALPKDSPVRAQMLALASTLDNYNNEGLCN